MPHPAAGGGDEQVQKIQPRSTQELQPHNS